MIETGKAAPVHFTARRGFITAVGFGMVSLYLLWAAYGAAPLGFAGHDEAGQDDTHAEAGHGDAGAATAQAAAFRGLVDRFVEQHKLPDGSVQPARPRVQAPAPAATEPAGHADHAAPHGDHTAPQEAAPHADPGAGNEAARAAGGEGPVEVYLMAYQFGFMPAVLRLEAGVPYRFRMMAVDVAHGASVRVGPGARVVRLRPGVLVEQELTFQRAGEHLLYCTVYCGLAHDRMQGKIIVTGSGAKS